MNQVLQQLLPPVLGFFGAYTLVTLVVLVLVEEAGLPIPIPGDSLLVLAGALALDRPLWFSLVALAGTYLAVLIGSSILYLFMRLGGRRFVTRFGKYLRLGPSRLARVERWFTRHHQHALVIGRLVPGMRIPTTALAGLTGLPYRRYLSGVAVAAGIWTALCFGLGVLMRLEGPQLLGLVGPLARQLVRTVPAPLLILLVAVVVLDALVAVALVRRLRGGRSREGESTAESEEGPRDRTRVA